MVRWLSTFYAMRMNRRWDQCSNGVGHWRKDNDTTNVYESATATENSSTELTWPTTTTRYHHSADVSSLSPSLSALFSPFLWILPFPCYLLFLLPSSALTVCAWRSSITDIDVLGKTILSHTHCINYTAECVSAAPTCPPVRCVKCKCCWERDWCSAESVESLYLVWECVTCTAGPMWKGPGAYQGWLHPLHYVSHAQSTWQLTMQISYLVSLSQAAVYAACLICHGSAAMIVVDTRVRETCAVCFEIKSTSSLIKSSICS